MQFPPAHAGLLIGFCSADMVAASFSARIREELATRSKLFGTGD